jgi:hypothetical protein
MPNELNYGEIGTAQSDLRRFAQRLPDPTIYNHFDKCVRLELPLEKCEKDEDKLVVQIIITFSDAWIIVDETRFLGIKYKRIRANFGISRGWLTFDKMVNISSPTKDRNFSFDMRVKSENTRRYDVEDTHSLSKETGYGASVKLEGVKPSISLDESRKLKGEAGTKATLSDSFGNEIFHVQESGTDISPQWSFNSGSIVPFRGKVAGKLAEFKIHHNSCSFQANFCTSHEAVRVLEAEVEGYVPDDDAKKLIIKQKAKKLIWDKARLSMSTILWRDTA